jgi:MFS family permease
VVTHDVTDQEKSDVCSGGPGAEIRAQVLPLYLPSLLSSISAGVAFLAIPLLVRELGADLGQTGLVLALLEIGGLCAALPAGYLTARWSYRTSGLVSALGFAALSITGWVANEVWVLAFAVFGIGMSRALWSVSRHAYASRASSVAHRGRLMATLGGVHRLGHLIGPAVAGVLAITFGLQILLLLMGALFVLAALSSAIFLNEGWTSHRRIQFGRTSRSVSDGTINSQMFPQRDSVDRGPTQGVTSLSSVLQSQWRPLVRNGVPIMILCLVRKSREVVLPLWGAHIGLGVDAIGFALSASWICDFVVFYGGGLLSDRYGRKAAALTTLLLLSVSIALLPLATSYSLFILICCIAGFGNGLSAGVVMTVGADLSPDKSTGQFLGLWRFIADIGGSASPLVVGSVAQLLSLAAAAPLIAVIGLLGSLIFVCFVRETGKPKVIS